MVCGDGLCLCCCSLAGWLDQSGRKGGGEEERRQLLISPPKIQKTRHPTFSTLFLNVLFIISGQWTLVVDYSLIYNTA